MRYIHILLLVLLIFNIVSPAEEEDGKDFAFLHFTVGAIKGIESPSLINWINDEAESIGAEERIDHYGLMPVVYAEFSFYINRYFCLGFGVGITNSNKRTVFQFYDEVDNYYEEFFEVSTTLSSFYGVSTIKMGSIGGFKPYFAFAGGGSFLNVYFEDFYLSGERTEHFLDRNLFMKQFMIKPAFGVGHSFFNIGDIGVEVGYVKNFGDTSYQIEDNEWEFKTDSFYIGGIFERSF